MTTRVPMTLEAKYRIHLVRLMEFIDGVAREKYPNDMMFAEHKLLEITPEDIERHFKNMAYGTPAPGPNDKPIHCRSSSLEFAKKSISFFLPRGNTRNPTKSVLFNQVIEDVKKAEEVRRKGAPSQAMRDLKWNEFQKTLEILESQSMGRRFLLHCKVTTMMRFQFHIIDRTDDVSHLETKDLSSHPQFLSSA
jgi:hypothetical protein